MERSFITYSSLTTETDYEQLDSFYHSIRQDIAITACAELIDTHSHAIIRDANRIKRAIVHRGIKPFVFISCLN